LSYEVTIIFKKLLVSKPLYAGEMVAGKGGNPWQRYPSLVRGRFAGSLSLE